MQDSERAKLDAYNRQCFFIGIAEKGVPKHAEHAFNMYTLNIYFEESDFYDPQIWGYGIIK